MRSSCLDCCRKHLSAALVLEMEAVQGYPMHSWIAVGHLQEAADEMIESYPELAHKIREIRLNYMASINSCLRLNNEGDIVMIKMPEKMPIEELIFDVTLQHINDVKEENEDIGS